MMNASQLSRQAWAEQRVMKIRYQKPEDLEVSEREVEVYGCDGVYLDTYCRLRREPRTFRIDRILDARLLDVSFHWDPKVEAFLRSRGWTGSVAKPAPQASRPGRIPCTDVGRQDVRGGLWNVLAKLLRCFL